MSIKATLLIGKTSVTVNNLTIEELNQMLDGLIKKHKSSKVKSLEEFILESEQIRDTSFLPIKLPQVFQARQESETSK